MLNESQKKVVEENHNLIYKCVQLMKVPLEEFYDIAALGLIKAAMTYRIDEYKFSTYAIKVICNNIKDELKGSFRNNKQNEISLDELLENKIDIKKYYPDISDESLMKLTMQSIKYSLGNKKQWSILTLLSKGYTQKEISTKLHISQSSVSNSIKIIKNIIKEHDIILN